MKKTKTCNYSQQKIECFWFHRSSLRKMVTWCMARYYEQVKNIVLYQKFLLLQHYHYLIDYLLLISSLDQQDHEDSIFLSVSLSVDFALCFRCSISFLTFLVFCSFQITFSEKRTFYFIFCYCMLLLCVIQVINYNNPKGCKSYTLYKKQAAN